MNDLQSSHESISNLTFLVSAPFNNVVILCFILRILDYEEDTEEVYIEETVTCHVMLSDESEQEQGHKNNNHKKKKTKICNPTKTKTTTKKQHKQKKHHYQKSNNCVLLNKKFSKKIACPNE